MKALPSQELDLWVMLIKCCSWGDSNINTMFLSLTIYVGGIESYTKASLRVVPENRLHSSTSWTITNSTMWPSYVANFFGHLVGKGVVS